MVALRLFEYLMIGLGLLLVVTQLVVPAIIGSPLFPIFRRRAELKERIAELKEEEINVGLEKEIRQRESALRGTEGDPAAANAVPPKPQPTPTKGGK